MPYTKDEKVAWREVLEHVEGFLDLADGLLGNYTCRCVVEDGNEGAHRGAKLGGHNGLVFGEWHEGGLLVLRAEVFGVDECPVEEKQKKDGGGNGGGGEDGEKAWIARIREFLPGVPSNVGRLV